MKKLLAAVAIAVSLAACQQLPWGRVPSILVGEPRIVLGDNGLLVVDQEPLMLRGAKSVTWTLPALPNDQARYTDFSVVINAPVKRVIRDGSVVRYVKVDGRAIERPLKCGQVERARFTCEIPQNLLEKAVLYTYTLKFKRDGIAFELDPTVMADG
jgi:hypothetical protein